MVLRCQEDSVFAALTVADFLQFAYAAAENTDATSRVARGRSASPKANPVATHWPTQKGQTISSPTALRRPVPRGSSCSSAGPEVPLKVVNGARSGLVTGSLASSRAHLWVATPINARSAAPIRSGRPRPPARTRPDRPRAVAP